MTEPEQGNGRATRVKICGLRDAETMRAMDGLPIDEVGFVFAKSRRQIAPELASELIAAARRLRNAEGAAPRTVGVFVNPTMDELRETLRIAPLDIVQLHGEESPSFCAEARSAFGVAVWKVLSVTPEDGADPDSDGSGRLQAYIGSVDGFLIDTAGGGTGKTFAWSVIDRYKEAAGGVPLYVAGGLHPDNVVELVKRYAPGGVDVSSGVETDGAKDMTKIRLFAERVQGV
ncbi:phosphoribosylanthranilate isomerase [Paenibacillus sp. GCM10023250]|uniref:phosphoribosylanthranilate isomerase n=1 Tax=Paenibacillus sp. GCM10023250 TaxID=3252648 RepID=UPI003613182A